MFAVAQMPRRPLPLVFMLSPGETLGRKFFDDSVGRQVIGTSYGSEHVFLLEVERGADMRP